MIQIIIGSIACFFGWFYFRESREMGMRMKMGIYRPDLENYRDQCFAILSINMIFSIFGWTVGTHLILREIEIFLGAFW